MAAQDDGELFDLYAADGAPLGVRKARRLVHRDGDWHRSLHIWVILRELGGPDRVLLQRRSAGKDTWPRAIDVAVAGHYRTREALEQALREADEEIGLALGPADVTQIGRRFRADAHAPGILDNEIQDIFVALADAPLTALRPSPDEVEALIALPIEEAVRLFEGSAESADGQAVTLGSAALSPAPVKVRREELIPDDDGYYARAMTSILARLRGEISVVWSLGGPAREAPPR